jgi:hypothetical protein
MDDENVGVQRQVWKFSLSADRTDHCEVRMPIGAQLLHVNTQEDSFCVWALVNPSNKTEIRTFRIAGNGHPIRTQVKYLGTVHLQLGLVFHVFEVLS